MAGISPGLHDFSREFYDSDPCPEPSLTSSGIRTLLESSPAHFAATHPRLSRWPEAVKPKARDESLGAVVKCLVLNRGHEVAALPFDNFTTKMAQVQRRQAQEDGKIAVTRAVYDQAYGIAELAKKQLGTRLAEVTTDATLIWRRPTVSGPIWCRERVDASRGSGALLVQTVGRAGSLDEIAKAAANSGLDVKAAWLLDASGEQRSALHVLILTIETEPPYLAIAKPLAEEWIAGARQRVDDAANLFARCLRAKEWPHAIGPEPLAQPFRK